MGNKNATNVHTNELPFNPKLIAGATMLLSILPGTILYALNFERLGKPEKKIPSLITYTLLFILVFLFQLNSSAGGTSLIVTIIQVYCGIHFYKNQNYLFRKYIESGGKKSGLALPLTIIILSVSCLIAIGLLMDFYLS